MEPVNANNNLLKKLFVFFSIFIFIMLLTCIITIQKCNAQEIIVNEYYNDSDPRDEWSELLVTQDNLDIQNYTFSDNAATTDCFQGRIRFKSGQALWTHLRAGTIIMIWHRPCNSSGTSHPTDFNNSDGYIEVDATNSTYFDFPDVGSTTCAGSITLAAMFTNTPCASNGGTTLNIANGGDLLQIKDASGNHVHALGHDNSAGSSWTGLSTSNKALMHNNTINGGETVRIAPGADLANCYGASGDFSELGTARTSKSSSNITFGLPNSCGSCAGENSLFWRGLREPTFTTQTVTPTWSSGTPGSISFSWTGATDGYSTDATIGYFVLRNTSNSFTAPSDGTTYSNGSTLGTATVLSHINSSTTTSYTDNTPTDGAQYFYRVYAYRYGTDTPNGNTYDAARGRAYNTTNFVSVSIPSPLPVELLYFEASKISTNVELTWSTATETNSDTFVIERSINGKDFNRIAVIEAAGYSNSLRTYYQYDTKPNAGKNYYRLKQFDNDGKYFYYDVRMVEFESHDLGLNIIYKKNETQIAIESLLKESEADVNIYDASGRLIFAEKTILNKGAGTIAFNPQNAGIYFVKVFTESNLISGKVVF